MDESKSEQNNPTVSEAIETYKQQSRTRKNRLRIAIASILGIAVIVAVAVGAILLKPDKEVDPIVGLWEQYGNTFGGIQNEWDLKDVTWDAPGQKTLQFNEDGTAVYEVAGGASQHFKWKFHKEMADPDGEKDIWYRHYVLDVGEFLLAYNKATGVVKQDTGTLTTDSYTYFLNRAD